MTARPYYGRASFNPHFTRTLLETIPRLLIISRRTSTFNPHFTRTLLETNRPGRSRNCTIKLSILILRGRFLKHIVPVQKIEKNWNFQSSFYEDASWNMALHVQVLPAEDFQSSFYEDASWNRATLTISLLFDTLSILILRGRFLKRQTFGFIGNRLTPFNPHFTRTLLETFYVHTWIWCFIYLSILILRGRFLKLMYHPILSKLNSIFQSSFYEDASWNYICYGYRRY